LVPEAGLTRSILEILLGVLPRRRDAPASKLLAQFVEPNAVSRRLHDTNSNTHLKGGCYCLVPEAGLTRSILGILLGVLPRRRDAPASKLLAQLVEPMPFLTDSMTQTKTPT
jgi:hypothetical protein